MAITMRLYVYRWRHTRKVIFCHETSKKLIWALSRLKIDWQICQQRVRWKRSWKSLTRMLLICFRPTIEKLWRAYSLPEMCFIFFWWINTERASLLKKKKKLIEVACHFSVNLISYINNLVLQFYLFIQY